MRAVKKMLNNDKTIKIIKNPHSLTKFLKI